MRRAIGRDADLLDRTLLDAERVHPSPLRRSQLRRVFWEAFTAGDIAFAPNPLARPEYATYRQEAAVSRNRDLPLLQTAHNAICRLLDRPLGPLLWSPRQRRTVLVVDGVKVTVDPPPRFARFSGYAPF